MIYLNRFSREWREFKSAGIETSGIVANVLDEMGDIESLSDEDKDDIKYFGGAVYNGAYMLYLAAR